MTEDNLLLNAEPVKEKAVLNLQEYEDNLADTQPDMHDPAWSDFVLRQFEPDEIYDGLPTTDGCRRVVNKLLGPIVKSVPIIAQAPTPQNDNHATVVWELIIRWDNNPLDLRTFGDVADVYIGNTITDFAIHAAATAATKAEGRALRKALQLKKVLTAEEISKVPAEDPSRISNGQITFINMMCERNNINVIKLLKLSKLHKLNKIEDVPYATAIQIIKYLNDGQNEKIEFPFSIKGYDQNWRKVNESII